MRPAREISDDKRSKRNAIEALAAKRRQQQDQISPSPSINLITDDEEDDYSNQTHVNRTFKPHRRTTVIPDSSSSSEQESASRSDEEGSSDSIIVDDYYISDKKEQDYENAAFTSSRAEEEEEEEEEGPFHQTSSSTTTTTTQQQQQEQQQPQFNLPPSVNNHIYAHQKQAIDWMLGIYNREAGCILADDMGLGKTMTSAAFISGLFHSNMARRVLIIAPKTLLAHWKSELEVCGLSDLTDEFGGSVNERQRVLRRVGGGSKMGGRGGGGIVLCTYGMLLHNAHLLSGSSMSSIPTKIKWDVLFLDEGHKIKNHKIQLRQKLDELTTTTRIVITGTPIQNNLMELWSLFDYVQPGLLGGMVGFKSLYERRIVAGNDRHATLDEREKAAAASVALKRHIAPYMLRREKKDVMGTGANTNTKEKREEGDEGSNHDPQQGSKGQQPPSPSSRPRVQSISKKNDLICWLKLNPMQLKLYEAFLFSDEAKAALNSTQSPLAAITVLKKICDHPALLSERAQHTIIAGAERQKRRMQMKLPGEVSSKKAASSSSDEEEESDSSSSSSDGDEFSFHKTKRMPDIKPNNNRQQQSTSSTYVSQLFELVHKAGVSGSCKTTFTLSLLRNLVSNNHKILIFSQSRLMLDILQAGIIREGWTWLRIDGTVASATERAQRVASFQSGAADIMMLTTQVGGLGLTLTAASRVIIVDPSWNPSTDQQSVDRAYRIGQDKHVVVYRLISCGTVEDKIYKKQVYKSGLAKGLLEDGDGRSSHAGTTTAAAAAAINKSLPTAYFTNSELKDLFTLKTEETHSSSTRRALNNMHAGNREDDPSLSHHIQFLHSLDGFVGTSDHDLLFSNKPEEKLHIRSEDFIVAPACTTTTINNNNNNKRTDKKSKNGHNSVYSDPSSQDTYNTTSIAAAGNGSQSCTNPDNYMWSGGGGDVSDMFAKALKLQEQDNVVATTTTTTGLTAKFPRAFSSSSSALVPKKRTTTTPEKTPEEQELSLQEHLEKTERLLSNKGLVEGLPDRGAKLEAKAALLRAELSAQRQGQGEEEVVVDDGGEDDIVIMDATDDDEEKEKEEEARPPLPSPTPLSPHKEGVSEQASFLRRLSGLASSFFTFSLTDAAVPAAAEVEDPSSLPPSSSSFEDRGGVEKQRMVVAQLQKRLYACAKTLNDPIKLAAYPDSPSALREKAAELEKEWRDGKERLKSLVDMM